MKNLAVLGAGDRLSTALIHGIRSSISADCRQLGGDGKALDEPLAVHRPEVVVCLPGVRGGEGGVPDLRRAEADFRSVLEAEPRQVIVVSSAAAYEPSHHHPGRVTEGRPPRKVANPVSVRWLETEQLAEELFSDSGATLTILRPATVAHSGGADFLSRLLSARVALTLPGHDPTLQLLAVEDLARAIAHVIQARCEGIFHVAPAGEISLRRALRLAGVRRVPVPRWMQRLGRWLLRGWALSPAHLDFIRYPWTVSGDKLETELGFVPERSSAEVAARLSSQAVDAEEVARAEGDGFGMDKGYIGAYGKTLFRFLHDAYWRIEHRGLEHVPDEGRGVLVGVHRGFMPWDGVMLLHLVARELERYPRFLIHPALAKPPFLCNYMTKLGGILACQENAGWVLEREGLLGIFPEGIQGAFTPYRRAYEIGKLGRDEYVKIALRHQAPLIPVVTVGSAEIYPILGRVDWRWFKRYTEWPYLPLTPTFPILPVPLPSKWHTRFLEPIHVERDYPPEAADDPPTVRAISQRVRHVMEEAIAEMLRRRSSIFFGSVFEPLAPAGDTSSDPSREPAGDEKQGVA